MIVADNPVLDACHYPDSNKWALRPPGMVFRANPAEYFDGEEPPSDQPGTFRPPVTSLAAPATPFVDRIRRIDDLPWEEWTSPRGQFHGTSKELSIALGARRNTPTGLGGHPFDVEYSRLAPGETGCPFHFHAAQWELFLIVSGQATIRAGDVTLQAGAGDVCLHPPGEPHQIINASPTEALLFYLIADNPPADYWHYPDSQKWGFRQPRMFFRPVEVDYYDGEESGAGSAPV